MFESEEEEEEEEQHHPVDKGGQHSDLREHKAVVWGGLSGKHCHLLAKI